LLNVYSKVLIQDWQGQTRIPVIFDKVVLFLMSYPSRLEPKTKRSHVRTIAEGKSLINNGEWSDLERGKCNTLASLNMKVSIEHYIKRKLDPVSP